MAKCRREKATYIDIPETVSTDSGIDFFKQIETNRAVRWEIITCDAAYRNKHAHSGSAGVNYHKPQDNAGINLPK